METSTLPPHFLSNVIHYGTTLDYTLQNQGLAEPSNNAHNLAGPLTPVHQALAVPQQTDPLSGALRPEEAGRE